MTWWKQLQYTYGTVYDECEYTYSSPSSNHRDNHPNNSKKKVDNDNKNEER
eukprot:CAMPEP_0170798100 /NCGR_PEP_ID=MMETSP0733-20121128/26092_1 /TAXON_ID=186038 /ORGANISM="Fragilariopsis kerguelensis, Strain L26-C5" /LENGTH=50 /DNA_ID=CAMNT_0011149263 /DNA_START=278 /DNA_END=430 /DNA_ORIENTATION=+